MRQPQGEVSFRQLGHLINSPCLGKDPQDPNKLKNLSLLLGEEKVNEVYHNVK